MQMVDKMGMDLTEGLGFLDYLVSPDLMEDFRFTLGEGLGFLGYLVSPDLVENFRFAFGERLERIGYFCQLPGSGAFQGVLLLFESTVLVHVRSETKNDLTARFGDTDQLVE